MFWVIALVILLVVLALPAIGMILDLPGTRNIFRKNNQPSMDEMMVRIQSLEDEVSLLGKTLDDLRDENVFMQRLLANPDRAGSPEDLPKSDI